MDGRAQVLSGHSTSGSTNLNQLGARFVRPFIIQTEFRRFELWIFDISRLFLMLVVNTGLPGYGACTSIEHHNTIEWTAIDVQLQHIRARIMAANIDIGLHLQNRFQ